MVPVLGEELTLLELPMQDLSLLGWTVTISEYATAPVPSLTARVLSVDKVNSGRQIEASNIKTLTS